MLLSPQWLPRGHCKQKLTTDCSNLAWVSKIRVRAGQSLWPFSAVVTSRACSNFYLFIYFPNTSNGRQRSRRRTTADVKPDCRLAVSHHKQLRRVFRKQRWLIWEPLSQPPQCAASYGRVKPNRSAKVSLLISSACQHPSFQPPSPLPSPPLPMPLISLPLLFFPVIRTWSLFTIHIPPWPIGY